MELLARRIEDIVSEHEREFFEADEAVKKAHEQRIDTAIAAKHFSIVEQLGQMIFEKRKIEVSRLFTRNNSSRRSVTPEEEQQYRAAFTAIISSSYPEPIKPQKTLETKNASSNGSLVSTLSEHLAKNKIPTSGTYAKLASQITARAAKYSIPASSVFSLLEVLYVPIAKKIDKLVLSERKDADSYQKLYDNMIDVLLSNKNKNAHKRPSLAGKNTVSSPLPDSHIKTPVTILRLQRIF